MVAIKVNRRALEDPIHLSFPNYSMISIEQVPAAVPNEGHLQSTIRSQKKPKVLLVAEHLSRLERHRSPMNKMVPQLRPTPVELTWKVPFSFVCEPCFSDFHVRVSRLQELINACSLHREKFTNRGQ